MNIAELFVSLGVKGSDKSLAAVTDLKKGLVQTKEVSLEAKAALIGAMYALERLFSASGQRGTDLTNFNATVGVSIKTLQEYQYAARSVGASNDEMAGTFKSVQSAMTNIALGKGAPESMERIMKFTRDFKAGIGANGLLDAKFNATHPEVFMQRLQLYAQREKALGNLALARKDLGDFGVGDNIQRGLYEGVFNQQMFAKAPKYNEGEVAGLDKSRAAFANVGNDIEMMTGRLNAKFGPAFAKDIGGVVREIGKLADVFGTLAQKTHALDWIGKAFEGWTGLIHGFTDAVTDLQDMLNKQEEPEAPEIGGVSTQAETVSNTEANVKGAIAAILSNFIDTAPTLMTNAEKAEWRRKWLDQGTPDNAAEARRLNASQAPRGAGPGARSPSVPVLPPPQVSAPYVPSPVAAPRLPRVRSKPSLGRRSPAPALPGAAPTIRLVTPPAPSPERMIAPPLPAGVAPAAPTPKQDVTVSQVLNFQHSGTEPQKTADSVKHAVQTAFRQMAAQSQVV